MADTTFFRNKFDNVNIINKRMITYMDDQVALLTADNTDGKWDDFIPMLHSAISGLQSTINNVDTRENVQSGATHTAANVIAQFKVAMSEEYPFVERALGGNGAEAMLEFYPHGRTEYSNALVGQMNKLTKRVYEAAVKYETQLGSTIADKLKPFWQKWVNARNTQVADMSLVEKQRIDRVSARLAANIVCHKTAHRVAEVYAENEKKAQTLCPFHLLYRAKRKKASKFAGPVAPGETAIVFNKNFGEDSVYHIANLVDNAGFEAWLAATPNADKGEKFVTNHAGQTHIVNREKLGGGDNTPYLLIKNTSATNEVTYEVVVK